MSFHFDEANPLSFPKEECVSENIFILFAQLIGHLAIDS